MNDEKKPVSKKLLQVSKAPPPISPLRGSGSLSSVLSPKRNNALPDWAKWKYMPEVEAIDACALALNFDPDSMMRSPQNWMHPGADIFLRESFPSDVVAEKFYTLLEIVKANKLQTIHFKINLPEFAAWCAPVVRDLTGSEIQPELAALAKTFTSGAIPVSIENTYPHQGNIKELTQDRAREWLRKHSWSIGEIHWLFAGFDPQSKLATDFPPPANAGDDVDRLNRARIDGRLKPSGHDPKGEPIYCADDVIKVAEAVDFGCWQIWKNLIAETITVEQTEPGAKVEAVKPGITKGQVIGAFQGLYFDTDQWSKALSNVPKWLEPARVMKGRKGSKTSATWNPVLIAAALYGDKGKGVPINKLNAVFVSLKDWADEWRETSALFSD